MQGHGGEMRSEATTERSCDDERLGLEATLAQLRTMNAKWAVETGPQEGNGWIRGVELENVEGGPFAALLTLIRERMKTHDRKIVAASFALRFGWASAVAFAPYFVAARVPDVRLENISLKFSASTLFERLAIHDLRPFQADDPLEALRAVLTAQATPVVEALYAWSRLPRKVIWGQVTSSWGAQFELILRELGRAEEALGMAQTFFAADGAAFAARPELYVVEHRDVRRIYQCRSSCCLYYKVESGGYCASCPLITQNERVARNKQWMERTLSGAT
jgi:ferric iron reductase protein FhuF